MSRLGLAMFGEKGTVSAFLGIFVDGFACLDYLGFECFDIRENVAGFDGSFEHVVAAREAL